MPLRKRKATLCHIFNRANGHIKIVHINFYHLKPGSAIGTGATFNDDIGIMVTQEFSVYQEQLLNALRRRGAVRSKSAIGSSETLPKVICDHGNREDFLRAYAPGKFLEYALLVWSYPLGISW